MTATFYVGDAVTVMNTLPEKSVDLILTSPPFLALRSYLPPDHPDKALEGGSQATPGAYIDWLLDVVEACARVLAPHGSLCFELGDTYSGSNETGWHRSGNEPIERYRNLGAVAPSIDKGAGWPLAKSLSLIPESFRWAMVYGHNPHTGRRTEPWRLRNVIRWVRPNPPVGALGDKFRPATSELMVFCKAKDRFFDLDAVREPHGSESLARDGRATKHVKGRLGDGDGANPFYDAPINAAGAPPLDWWNIPPGGYPGAHYAVWPPELLVKPIKAMCPEKVCRRCGEARRRIVGDPVYSGRSGVVTPPAKWESGSPERGRPQQSIGMDSGGYSVSRPTLGFSDCGHKCAPCEGTGVIGVYEHVDQSTGTHLGNQSIPCPTCGGRGDPYRPGLVLDPFAGSGTTLSVATGHGRDAIGIDLDERNYELSLDRVGPLILQRGEIRDGTGPPD